MRQSHIHYLILAATLASVWPQMGIAGSTIKSEACVESDVFVTAPEARFRKLVCEVADDQAAMLADCGIHQSRPISVSIVQAIEGFPKNCVGAYHCATDEVQVVLPQTFSERNAHDSIYRGLAPEAAFLSVLRHELTHAFTEHATEDRPISSAAHEYIAFAFQIEAMTEEERSAFFLTNGKRPAKSLDTFNMFIYGLLPGAFAGAAWLHFSAPDNGCAFVEKIIAGEVVLGAPILSRP